MRLRIKFLLVILLVGIGVTVYMDRVWIKSTAHKTDLDRFALLATHLAPFGTLLAAALAEGDERRAGLLISAAANANPDLSFIAVLDPAGAPWILYYPARAQAPTHPQASISAPAQALDATAQPTFLGVPLQYRSDDNTIPLLLPPDDPDIYFIEHALLHQGQTVGTLRVGIPYTRVITPEQRRWEGLLLIWFVIFFGVSWLLFERYIHHPLLRLSRATWALASGDYKVKLPRAHRDEMGALITGFRLMREAVQKRENEMLSTNERMQSIFDRAIDGIFLTDHSGLIETINPSGLRMFGCAKGQGEGENIDHFIRGLRERIENGDFYTDGLDNVTEDGGYPVLMMDGTRRDGATFSIELGISRLTQGNKVKYLGIFRDATKRQEIDQQMAGYATELEARNVLLDHTISDIASLSQAKTNFLAGLSDELRTPMNALLGMLTLLQQDKNLTPSQSDLLNTALSSGNALITMMNDAFDFSKIDSAPLDLEAIDFDMRRVIEDTCAVYERVAVGKDILISSVISASVPDLVQGDPTRLRQILNNLLSNAVRYTDQGEIVVRCDKIAEQGEEMIFEIQVSDTGQGMSREKRESVIANLAKPINGSAGQTGIGGVGLPISRRLVEMFGGEMGINSQEGSGTTLWFTLRVKKARRDLSRGMPLQDISGVRVLYVDDNPTSLEIMERILEIRGVLCTTVRTADEAIAELRRGMIADAPFDLVFIDRMMPGMDGLELGRRLAEDEMLAKVKRVLLTSISVRGDGQMARDAGFHGYFTKPLNQNQIYDCVATVLGLSDLSEPMLVTRHTLREQSFKKVRVLLVEDNIVNQKVTLGLLAALGVSADLATNGQEAIDAVFTKKYDAVLMDCEMPVMSGYEATRRIRERESEGSLPRVPIIALTAHAAVGYQEKCREVGMDDHLAKPVRKEMIELALREWIKNFPKGG